MAIYKLGDIAEIKRGSSPRPILNWLTEDDTKLPWAKISDINNNQINLTKQFVNNEWKEKGLIGNYDDLFVTNSATPGVPFIQKNKSKIAYHDGFLKVSPNENIVLKKYLFFKLIIDRPKLLLMGNGAVFINLSSEILKDWKINLPSISDQQKIIDIIEPKEDLFLKFSNTVRIDTFEHTKNDLKNLIDIIEPIESLINKSIKIKSRIEELINNKKWEENKKIEDFVLAKNSGFPYTKDDKKNDGKYKIFTIKNITSKTKFETTDLIKNNKINFGDVITGLSGTIGTADINIDNDWVSNQRTLCLGSNHSLLIQQSIIKQKDFLFQQATGAVQKNIKAKDILNLKMLKENKHDLYFNNLYLVILKTLNNLDKIYNLLINLLIK